MITAKKAKEMASGKLNWWQKWRKQRKKQSIFLNLYSFSKESIQQNIKSQAKLGRKEFTYVMFPEFFLMKGHTKLEWFNYSEQLDMYQLSVNQIESELKKSGYKVVLKGSELTDRDYRVIMQWGLVDTKYTFYINWE